MDGREYGGEASVVTSALNFFSPAAAAAAQSDSILLDSPSKAKSCAPVAAAGSDPQGTTNMENLVGSQKRKARKTKITHLVRTADGSVSPVEGEWRPMVWKHMTSVLNSLAMKHHDVGASGSAFKHLYS